jgi:hypothetical protein
VSLSIYVDDIIRNCQGHEEDIVEDFRASDRLVQEELARLHMPLYPDTAKLAARLSAQALGRGKTATTQVRRLGIDYADRQVAPGPRKPTGPGRKGQAPDAAVRRHRVKQALKRARIAKRILKSVPMGANFLWRYPPRRHVWSRNPGSHPDPTWEAPKLGATGHGH